MAVQPQCSAIPIFPVASAHTLIYPHFFFFITCCTPIRKDVFLIEREFVLLKPPAKPVTWLIFAGISGQGVNTGLDTMAHGSDDSRYISPHQSRDPLY